MKGSCVVAIAALAPLPAIAVAQAAPDMASLRARTAALTPAQQMQARTLFSSAFKLWQAGDFDSAEVGFREGLELDPANGPANFYYADILQRRGDPRATSYFARATALSPLQPEGLKAQAQLDKARTAEQAQAAQVASVAASGAELRAAVPGAWKFKGDGWSFPATANLTLGEANQVRSTNIWAWKFKAGEIDGDQLKLSYENCTIGCKREAITLHLVSPTMMEGTEIIGGRLHAFHAEKQA
jgi:tetratricopeptide (TPR) repeat protein